MDTETNSSSPENSNLQFDKAEFDASHPTALTCQGCKSEIKGTYFEVNRKVFCGPCKEKVEKLLTGGSRTKRLILATAAGSATALLGAGLYYGIEKLTGYEFGLIAIVVGFMVGTAVRWGSHRRGGLGYQLLAVFLTYNSIVMTYLPSIIEDLKERHPKPTTVAKAPAVPVPSSIPSPGPAAPVSQTLLTGIPAPAGIETTPVPAAATPTLPAAPADTPPQPKMTLGKALLGIGALFLLVYMVPFLMGFKNIIGLVIIAFGLYEAWKINAKPRLVINGPFQAGPPPT